MIAPQRYAGSIMVLYCTALHLIWAALIISDPAAMGATPVAMLATIFWTESSLCVALVTASVLSVAGLFSRLPWAIVLMIPQQSFLLVSACGAMAAVAAGQFADGVARPQAFIAADQAHIILASFCHALAIIATTYERTHK